MRGKGFVEPRLLYLDFESCRVKSCENKKVARGWCHSHWKRWRLTGSVKANKPLSPRGKGPRIIFTPEYRAWNQAKNRCSNPKNQAYRNYGARGITFCRRWNRFNVFLSDMGHRPSPTHSLDRINNNSGYKPSNCKWSTKKEQVANRRPKSEWSPR